MSPPWFAWILLVAGWLLVLAGQGPAGALLIAGFAGLQIAAYARSKAPPQHPYFGAKVAIDRNEIRLYRNNGDNRHIAKDEVDYIDVYGFPPSDGMARCWVDLRSFNAGNCDVVSVADGFHALERWMLSLPGFDRERYREALRSESEFKVTIWERPPSADASIDIQGGIDGFEKLQEGLWLENLDLLVPWGRFSDLEHQPSVKARPAEYPNPTCTGRTYAFFKPTLLNGLTLRQLETSTPNYRPSNGEVLRDDLPVIEYTADVRLNRRGQDDFEALYDHIASFWGGADKLKRHDDLKDASWQRGRITLSIRIWKPEGRAQFRQGCWLSIGYQPDLAPFLSDAYQRDLRLHEGLEYGVFDVDIELYANYRSVREARYAPRCFAKELSQSTRLAVWRDNTEQRIGLASKGFALIYPSNAVTRISTTRRYFRESPVDCTLYLEIRGFKSAVPIGQTQGSDGSLQEAMPAISNLLRLPYRIDSFNDNY